MSEAPSPLSGLPRFDPLSVSTDPDPYRIYEEYRRLDPVHWSGSRTGRHGGRWFVFDYQSASKIMADKRFCRQPVAAGGCPVSTTSADAPPPPLKATAQKALCPVGPFAEMTGNWLLFQDPPRHTRLRSAVKPLFTLPVAQALRPMIEKRALETLKPLEKLESFDLVTEFASAFPLDVITDLLGLGVSDRAAFREWSAALRDALDRPRWGSGAAERADGATRGLRDRFEAAWRRHREGTGEGVVNELLKLQGLESGISKDEAFATFTFLISAGHETSSSLISTGMYLFAKHPGERRRLMEQPALISKAIDEILRFESPVQMAARNVAEDVQIENRRLLRGQRVEVILGSANRDPSVFEDPDRFDIGRKPNPHLAFGVGGHFCIGASLGRLMGAVALPLLLERIRVLDYPVGTNPWSRTAGFRGLTHLPVRTVKPLLG